jgi:hypothetical protein
VLSAIAHIFSGTFNRFYIPSGHSAADLCPWGSHPLLDHYYSSAHLDIEHQGIEWLRLYKVALVAGWGIALHNIMVCEGENPDGYNCGACEKCLRTMTALLALGKLKECRSFALDDLTASLLDTLVKYEMIYSDYDASCYRELLEPLTKLGRLDLVKSLQSALSHYERARQ